MKTKLLCGLIASVLLCGQARASELLTYLASTPLETTGSPKLLSLPQFDPGLGFLTEVKLTYWGEVLQTGKVENTGALTPMNYTFNGSASLSLSKFGGPVLFTSAPGNFSITQSDTITAAFDNSLDFGGVSGRTTVVGDTDWIAPAAYLDPELAAYLGTGMMDFTSLATSSGSLLITAGNGLGSLSTKAGATLQVEYSYTLIPEPSTYAAWLGLIAIGAALRHRRTRQPA